MMLSPLILAWSPAVALPPPDLPELYAISAQHVELGTGETLDQAIILVEGGKLVTIGEDLVVERGIPVYELGPDQVVMPGLVNAYTRVGMSGGGYNDSRPWRRASDELYPPTPSYKEVLETGVTTMGQYPAGNGIPGRSIVIRPRGGTVEEMAVKDDAYLKIIMSSSRTGKGNISAGFEEADEWLEKEAKNREKWEKAKEKFDKEKDKEKKAKLDPGTYKSLEPDKKGQAFLELRDGSLKALISIRTAGDYLHLLDAIGEEEFEWDLRVVMTRNLDLFHVREKISEAGMRVVLEPELSLHPGTMRQRNTAAEFSRGGTPVVFVPRSDSIQGFKDWRRHVGEIIASGLDRAAAVRSITLEPAGLLGVDEMVGSLEAGKQANLVILSGDPFEPGTKVDAVILEGDLVNGEVNL